jgi:pyridoxine/pyridoxamine 5'-phosphate oxidase
MQRAELLAFLRSQTLAVESSLAADGAPQAALVGIAVSEQLEVVFDTVETSRKAQNLRRDPRICLVIGWEHEVTVQIEGVADFPVGAELERLLACYLAAHPSGRERLAWPGITHVRVRPRWLRFSDFSASEPRIVECTPESLR